MKTTQIDEAKKGLITPEMELVTREEEISIEKLQSGLAQGEIVILKNKVRQNVHPVGVGKGLFTKVNANIGTSKDKADLELEKKKAKTAVRAGSDTIMDLSTGGNLDRIRKAILETTSVPLGTVPIYQMGMEALNERGSLVDYTVDELFNAIERQAKQGVDYMTVHCGVTQAVVELLLNDDRLTGIVSRGGGFHADWMIHHERENPLYEYFDRLLELAREYDVVLSLGDGLRPGSIADSLDELQVRELYTIGRLVKKARKGRVQTIVEGPGHVPIDQIEAQVLLEKKVCHGAPFYVLGPIPTDVAPGYDHITSAIGGAIAAKAGADFLCYVTPSEHLSLPTEQDVRLGVIGARIAAHVGDIAKLDRASRWDREMSVARGKLQWKKQLELALDPEEAKERIDIDLKEGELSGPCSMCSEYCPMLSERLYR